MIYPNHLSVREARDLYFAKSGFDDRTYTDSWVKLPLLSFHIYLPNFSARRKVVPFHDIDHILTEYGTDWVGEWEISAYELGCGCGGYWVGWLINSQAILAGAFRAPKKSLRAFARGRRSKGVFGFTELEPLLAEKVGALRAVTTAEVQTVNPTARDVIQFYLFVLISLSLHLAPFLLLAFWWISRRSV